MKVSKHAHYFEPALRLRRRERVASRDYVAGVVVHTTGFGPVRRSLADRDRFPTPLDAAVWLYSRIMPTGPHYVVGQDGTIVAVMPEDRVAYGAAAKKAWRYKRRGEWSKKLPWWSKRWLPLGVETPYDLGAGKYGFFHGGSINRNAVHIEVVPPESGRFDEWSGAAWSALSALVVDVCERWSLQIHERTVVTHADLCPVERSRPSGPYDVHPGQWPSPSEALARINSLRCR